MSSVVIITASPSVGSVDALQSVVGVRIRHSGHTVVPLVLRELPAAALLAGDAADPDVAGAVAAVEAADGVVVISPVSKAAYSGLLKVFLDLLPADAFAGKALLPVMTGAVAPESAIEYALRPVLSSLMADFIGRGCAIPDASIRVFPGGGAVLDAASALSAAESTDEFLAALAQQPPASPLPRATGRVSPVAGAPDLTVVHARVGDPVLEPLLRDLMIEYSTRYGGPSPYTTLTEVPASDFGPPDGAFLALTENGDTVAGGALRRFDDRTAEVKRVWTSSRHRRRGLALRLMAELEHAALELGYRRIHLTTGKRQPEAVSLYLAAGYLPRFDVTAERASDGRDSGPLAFGKELVPGAGLVDWVEPDDYYGTGSNNHSESATDATGTDDTATDEAVDRRQPAGRAE